MTTNLNFKSRRRGTTVAGLGGLALASVLLLCGAGNVPIENFTPQGAMQADLNAGGHSVTNAATLSATNVTAANLTVNGKTLGVNNALTLAGTDGSTLNVGAGGTLGSASYMYPPPPGSIVVIIGDSIQTNSPSGVYPAQVLSALPAFAGIPVYDYAIGGTTAGPSSSTTNSGLYVLAAAAPAYVEFINGTQVNTGNAAVATRYAVVTGDFIFYAMYGANDVYGVNGETLSQFISAMNSIATTVHGYGSHAKVVFPTITDSPRVSTALLAQWNQDLSSQTMAMQGSGAQYADYLADEHFFFANMTNSTGNVWTSDGVHPAAIAVPVNAGVMADAYLRHVTQPHSLGEVPGATLGPNAFTGIQTINDSDNTLYPGPLVINAPNVQSGGEVYLSFGITNASACSYAAVGFVNNGGAGSTSNQAVLGLGGNANFLRVDGLGNGIFVGSATASGFAYAPTTLTGAATLAINTSYLWNGGSNATLTLPATCAVGNRITLVGNGAAAGLATISKASGQSIYFGSGTAYSTVAEGAAADSITLVCTVANTTWNVESSTGSFTDTP